MSGTWVIDLDGVIWLAGEEIPGSAEAVRRLRAAGHPVVFATNNAEPTLSELVKRLAAVGVEAEEGDVVSSAQAAAGLAASAGPTALACGGPGLAEALGDAGVRALDAADPASAAAGPVHSVVVGMTRAFDYDTIARCELAVRAGARLIGTNEDPTHPTPAGLLPGSGAIIAAVSVAAQTAAEMAGKPHPPMVDLLRARLSDPQMVVGDRPATDGELARRLGVRFGLVLSGVTAADDPGETSGPVADETAPDLASLVEAHLRG